MIEVEGAGKKRLNFLVQAKPGMGKTSSMAYLGMKWVDEPDKFPFDVVFILPLRNVNADKSLAQVIVDQHELDEVDREYIQALLSRKTKQKVLLILDGYDEYTAGTNKALDKAIESGVGNCFVILTSRPGTDDSGNKTYVSKEIRDKMDGEVKIEGFSEESKCRFCLEYFGSEEETLNLLLQVIQKLGKDRYEELSTPFVLLMICILFKETGYLPNKRTELYETFRELAMDRTTWKTFGCKSSQVKDITQKTSILGKFAWRALNKDIQQLLLNKEDLEKECPDIMKLGLLHEVDGPQKATLREQPSYLSFTHKSLQEMEASKFVTQELETSENIEKTLKELFPSWEAVRFIYREVIIFCAGLMKDPKPLVQFVYEMQVEDYLSQMRIDLPPSIDADLFKSLHAESAVRWPDDPVHNEYINHYDHRKDDEMKRPRDLTPIRTASRLYVLNRIKENIECNIEEYKLSECTMHIYTDTEDKAVMKNLLITCHQISQHQAVTDFFCYGSRGVDLTGVNVPVMSENTHSLMFQALPASYLKNILPQLFHCSDSLKRLVLHRLDLNEVEHDIDKLLERIVSQHERKQFTGNLRLELLGGSKWVDKDGTRLSKTDLSPGFVDKWKQRCEAISSIELNIGSASRKDIAIAIWGRENYNLYKNQAHLFSQEARAALFL